MSSLRILLIDDHAMFRSGMSMVLQSAMGNVEIVEAGSLDEAVLRCVDTPAVILLDIQLQGLNGLECIAILQRRWPRTPIVMLSSYAEPSTVNAALARGATTFVSKADTAAAIVSVIERVLKRELPVAVPGAYRQTIDDGPRLTPRQCEVLNLLCQGLPNKVIGKRLDLSENTVRGHVQALLNFLQVSSRTEAAFEARRRSLVS